MTSCSNSTHDKENNTIFMTNIYIVYLQKLQAWYSIIKTYVNSYIGKLSPVISNVCTVSTCTVARPWFLYFVPFLLTLVPPCYRLPCGNVLVSFPHPFAIPGLMPPCSLYAFLLPGYYPPVSLPQNLYRFFCLFYPQVYRLSILYPFFPFLLLFALRVSVFFFLPFVYSGYHLPCHFLFLFVRFINCPLVPMCP